ncbi:MAG: TetR/AcrR family transcriptional regulator, partial [Sphingobium sp.]
MREIVAEAGVNNATFFRHHADKKALLDHVAQKEIDQLVAASLPSGHGLKGYKALCDYVDNHRHLWRALLTGGAGGAMRERYMRISRSVASEYEGITGWLPHELSVICSTTLIVETISWWLTLDDDAYAPDDIAEILDRLVNAAVIRS